MRMTRLLGATALVGALAIVPSVAFAQTDTPGGGQGSPTAGQETPLNPQSEVELESGQSTTDDQTTGGDVVVTGSRIRRPNLDSAVPITSIGGEETIQRGTNNLADSLNELPQLRSTVTQQNPGLGIGIAGLNLLDLRGLGTQRTLTLVNGRRHVAGDIQNNAVSVDVNTIPNDLIERIDIVTGAQSAVYGSDAIAGVVNFVLRRDFDGVQVRGGTGISDYGAGGNQFASAIAGKNFADGKANITLTAEYARQDRVFASDIPFLRRQDGFVTVDTDPAGLPNGSDGIPDRIFARDIRSASINRLGLVAVPQAIGSPLAGVGIVNGGQPGLPYNLNYVFTPDGRLVPQTGSRVSTGPLGTFIGGNGQNGREENQLSVIPSQERFNSNLLAHYTFSDALEVFVEAKFAQIDTVGSNSGPAFTQGATFGDVRERPRLDNPFLNAADRTTIANAYLASGLRGTTLTSRAALTDADRVAIADGSFRFLNARNLLDLGLRDESTRRTTYRAVAGIRGTFNDDWQYEISGNYGRTEEKIRVLGNVISQRLLLALDSGRNPATGQIQCRSQFDPAAATAYDTSNAGDVAALAADIAACVPYNPFGAPDNRAAAAYIVSDTNSSGQLEQYVVNGFVSGDTSGFFELPGGPVRFSVGGEYRRENAFFQADPLIQSGRTFLNALQTFDPDPFEVKEAFGELQLPLITNKPFFHDLTITGAGRISDYNGSTGTVYTYNAGVEYAPVQDIRFRASYGRAVRAPNYTETGSPLSQNFAPGFQDPCRPANIGTGTQFRAANCAAALGALLNNPDFQALPVYSLELLSGSNPDLTEEKSNSLTIGAVIQPRFVPGLSLTVDYFDVEVNDVIVSPSAQAIANSCVDLPTLDNQFCDLIQRNLGGGDGPAGEAPGEILVGTLQAIPLNFASRRRRGIDFELAYRRDLSEDVTLNTRVQWTHNLKNSNFENPTTPDFENVLLTELGNPRDEVLFNAGLTIDRVTIGYRARYVGPQVINLFEDTNSVGGRAPQDDDYSDIREYPEVLYQDIRFDIRVGDEGRDASGLNFYVGVDNVTDIRPPLGATGTGTGSSIYNIRGRNFFAGARVRF